MRRRPSVTTNTSALQDRKSLRRQQKAERRQEKSTHRATLATIDIITALGRSLFAPEPVTSPQPSGPATTSPLRRATGLRTSTALSAAAPAARAPVARPADAKGRITIHFEVKRLSKGNPTSSAVAHQDYLERENARVIAVTDTTSAEPPMPVSVEATADLDGPPTQAASVRAGPGPAQHQPYLERDGAPDRVLTVVPYWYDGPNAPIEAKSGIAIFGNTGGTQDERRHLWRMIEAFENTPGPGHLRIWTTPERWSHLEARPDFPAVLLHARLSKPPRRNDRSEAGEVGEVGEAPETHRSTDVRLWRVSRKLPDVAAAEDWLRSNLPGAQDALRDEPGRGGTIQYRAIGELAKEMTSEQRLATVWDYTQIFRDRNLPYFVALHKPDPKKDSPDNWHVHIDFYDRPIRCDPKTGLWDIETVRYGTNRHPKFDHIPNKDRDVHSRDWIPMMRQRFVQIMNKHLAAAGIPKRYTAESYADMGLDKQPGEHLGAARAAAQRKPEPVQRATAAERLTQALTAETADYAVDIADRYLARLKPIGYKTDRAPEHPAARERWLEFVELARRQAELARRRKQHQSAVARGKGQLAAEHRRLAAEVAEKQRQQAEQPETIRSPAGFATRLAAIRTRLADVEQQTTDLDLAAAQSWSKLEAEQAGPGALGRKRMVVLLKQLDRIRNASLHPSVAKNAQRTYAQKAMDDSIAAQRALDPLPTATRIRPPVNVFIPRAAATPSTTDAPTQPASPAPTQAPSAPKPVQHGPTVRPPTAR